MQELFKILSLSEEHRKELKEKRGFTDETINKLQFRSLPFVKWPSKELYPQLYKGETLHQTLLKNNILIPYFNAEGGIIHLRPHKSFIPATSPQPYCEYIIDKNLPYVIICESEFKAIALWQLGLNAIGLNGILSFADKHKTALLEMIKPFKTRYILFDTEIKNNPMLDTYKQDVTKRYDTEYANYIMAWICEQEKDSIVKIVRLPYLWIEKGKGKIDCDTAVAKGHTKEEFEKLLKEGVGLYDYLGALPDECRSIVQRKIKKYFYHLKHHKLFEGWKGQQKNKYIWKKKIKVGDVTEEKDEIISNFIMKLIRTYMEEGDNVLREVEFINEYGEKTPRFLLSAKEITDVRAFREFCASKGDFMWLGDEREQLIELFDMLSVKKESDTVVRTTENVGEIESGRWLFANTLLDYNKPAIYEANEEGIICESIAYGIKVKNDSTEFYAHIPKHDSNFLVDGKVGFDLPEFLNDLSQIYDSREVMLGIGWTIANIFSGDIFKKYGCFPLLHICGKTNTGKTTLAQIYLSILGLKNDLGLNGSISTSRGLDRLFNSRNNIPVFVDQWVNKNTSNSEFYASAFNRQGRIIASKSADNKTIKSKISSTIMLAGEERPTDSALLSRCIIVETKSNKQKNSSIFDKIYDKIPQFNSWLYFSAFKHKDEILSKIDTIKSGIYDLYGDNRSAITNAIALAPLDYWAEDIVNEKFDEMMLDKITKSKEIIHESHQSVGFWNDLIVMHDKGLLGIGAIRIGREYSETEPKDVLYFRLSTIYREWVEYCLKSSKKSPIDETSLKKYLEESEFCLGNKVKKIDGVVQRCLTFDVGFGENNETIAILHNKIKKAMEHKNIMEDS